MGACCSKGARSRRRQCLTEVDVIETYVLQRTDLDKLIDLISLYEDVFEMKEFTPPGKAHLTSLLNREGVTFLVALSEGKVVGGLTAHDLPSTYFEASEVYIYDLAVAREHQRQGIGKQLLSDLAAHCQKKGASEIFVQADADDLPAIKFYQAAGGVQESVFHFSYDTKVS